MKDHLKQHRMNYLEHLIHAFKFGGEMIYLGLISIVHGFIPSLFPTKGIDRIHDMHYKLKKLGDKPKSKGHKWNG